MPEKLLTRDFQIRSADLDERTVTGIAVPWNTPVKVRDWSGEYVEQIARGAVQDSDDAKLYAEHRDIIGRVISHRDTPEGWEVTARISETARGNDVYALLRDGALDRFSIGFEPIEHTESRDADGVLTITRTKVRVREVSVVPFPAYEDAKVTGVRSATATPPQEGTAMPTQELEAQLAELRTGQEDTARQLELLVARGLNPAPQPTARYRTAGAMLQALVEGDEEARAEYTDVMARAFDGATTDDSVLKAGWVGDLTRIFDASSGVLSQIFSTGTLPAKGNSVEFGRLKSNTVDVDEQEDEGDDLTTGKIELETATAPVKTYGGATSLSRQVIERSTLPYLDRSLQALAIAAGARKKAVLRAAFNTLVTARRAVAGDAGVVTLGNPLADLEAGDLTDLVIDAAIKYEGINLAPEALIASPSVFKLLARLETEGKRVLRVAEGDSIGRISLPGLEGSINGLLVACDTGRTDTSLVFANRLALRQYDSAVVSLQDENVLNLSKDFSVYRYGAVADEIPAAVVPVKIPTGD